MNVEVDARAGYATVSIEHPLHPDNWWRDPSMKLDFIVPGFSKCGTTSFCCYLGQHPEIYIPKIKEPNFFAFNYGNGWDWYQALFRNAGQARVHGEGSTFYTAAAFEEQASARILRYFPEIRLIFIARNPIARLESSYRELHHSGHGYGVSVPPTISQALKKFRNLLDDTLYWQRINTYRRHVPDSRIHVLFLEDLFRDPATELANCFRFLGVDPTVRIKNTHRRLNTGTSKLYDSPLMGLIRSYPFTNQLWDTLPFDAQNRIGRLLGLRRLFRKPISWDPRALQWVTQEIAPDAGQFLKHYGKPPDFWSLRPKAIAA
jgi:hypothetical protein